MMPRRGELQGNRVFGVQTNSCKYGDTCHRQRKKIPKEEYLKRNVFLPDINNERADAKNATYRANMLRLERYVLVEAKWDTMLVPRQTSQHGFWPWGQEYGDIVPMEKSEGYLGDWIGLRTLDEAGRLMRLTFEGDHLRFTSDFWSKQILPLFG